MSESFEGFIEIRNANGTATIRADANTADIRAGGNGTRGGLLLLNEEGRRRIHLDASGGGLIDPVPTSTRVNINGTSGAIRLGGDGTHGELVVGNDNQNARIRLDGFRADISLGGDGADGNLVLSNNEGQPRIRLNAVGGFFIEDGTRVHVDGTNGVIRLAGTGAALRINDGEGREVFQFDAGNAVLRIGTTGNEGDLIVRDGENREVFHVSGNNAGMRIGTAGNEGDISVRDASDREVFQFDAGNAVLRIGTTGNEGHLIVRDGENREVFHVSGNNAGLRIGTAGNDGDISVRDASDREVFQFDAGNAVLRIGSQGNEGDIICRDDNGNESIHLNGGAGDIILRNADCAEDFDVADSTDIGPGTVVAIDENGELRESREAYERTVAGVISGAGEYKPGIRLGRRETAKTRLPVALVGKVYCKADAAFGAIRFGDLLTTSPTPGHAMKASDPARAFGAVIGKALQPLESGQDLIPILVALQ